MCGATAGHDPKEDLRYVWSFELQIIGSNSFYDDNLVALMRMIEMNTSAATTPTKMAATHSIESMKRSMILGFTYPPRRAKAISNKIPTRLR